MKKIGMGLIGPGFVAAHHLDAARRLGDVDIVAIADSSQQSTEKKAQAYNVDRAYGDYKALIADPDVQVIHNTTPNHLHLPVTLAALRAGKHVISDKPLALNAEEGLKLRDAAVAAKVAHVLTFNYRGNPLIQQARGDGGSWRDRSGEFYSPLLSAGLDERSECLFMAFRPCKRWPHFSGVRYRLALVRSSRACFRSEDYLGVADLTTVVPVRYSSGARPYSRATQQAEDGKRPAITEEQTNETGSVHPAAFAAAARKVLAKLKALEIDTVELGTGNYPGDAHCKLSMLDDASALKEFRLKLDDHGISISALSCHGNPLHPDPAQAERAQEVNRKTILLAEKLGVTVVVDFSGCLGDSPQAKAPNWVTCPWPPEYLEILKWQWDKVVAPYWTQRAKFAADHGVKIAIEMHPGFVVYSPETLLRLREIAGPAIGCNYDPSHMFWQNIDPIAAVRILGEAVFHVHAKDTQLYSANLPRTGVLDTKPYTDERNRGWIFRTCGYGHGAEWWKEFVSTLRMFGYDGVLSIEHEDSLLSPEEGLTRAAHFLSDIVLREQPSAPWWV